MADGYDDTDFIPQDDDDSFDPRYPEAEAIRQVMRSAARQGEPEAMNLDDGSLPQEGAIPSAPSIPQGDEPAIGPDGQPIRLGTSGRMLRGILSGVSAFSKAIPTEDPEAMDLGQGFESDDTKQRIEDIGKSMTDATNETMKNFDPSGSGFNQEDPLEQRPEDASIPKGEDPIGQGVKDIAQKSASDFMKGGYDVANQAKGAWDWIKSYFTDPGSAEAAKHAQSLGPEDGSPSAQKLFGLAQLNATDPEKAKAAMANFKSMLEHQRWGAVAQYEKGDLAGAAQTATQAMTNFLDGMETKFTPNGQGVTATVSDPHSGLSRTFQLSGDQFYKMLGSLDMQYDHLDHNGISATLNKYGQQTGRGGPGAVPMAAQGQGQGQPAGNPYYYDPNARPGQQQMNGAGGQPGNNGQNGNVEIARGGGGGALHEAMRRMGYSPAFISQAFALNGYDQKKTADWLKSRIPDMEKNQITADKNETTREHNTNYADRTDKVAKSVKYTNDMKAYIATLQSIAKQKGDAGRAAATMLSRIGVNQINGTYNPAEAQKGADLLQKYYPALQMPTPPEYGSDEGYNPQRQARPGAPNPAQMVPQAEPPQHLLQRLMANPTAQESAMFDARYGTPQDPHPSQRVLRQGHW